MFDLNVAITDWRAALRAQPNFRGSDLEELEDHLREEVDALTGTGLTEEEAYIIASRRLGKPEDLNGEFALADPERRRRFRLSWMITGALALTFIWLAAEVLTNFGLGTIGRIPEIPLSPRGLLGLGWLGGMMRLILLLLGGFLVWRLLATDRSAHRLKSLSGGVVIMGALLLAGLALATRMGSQVFFHNGLRQAEGMTVWVVGAWFQFFLMVLLPVLLLLGLWRLVRS